MAKVNFDEIRKNYPAPVSADESDDIYNCYCVGGALCLTLGQEEAFPDVDLLAIALIQANPALSATLAHRVAKSIIHENDIGEFENAWEGLRLALLNT